MTFRPQCKPDTGMKCDDCKREFGPSDELSFIYKGREIHHQDAMEMGYEKIICTKCLEELCHDAIR